MDCFLKIFFYTFFFFQFSYKYILAFIIIILKPGFSVARVTRILIFYCLFRNFVSSWTKKQHYLGTSRNRQNNKIFNRPSKIYQNIQKEFSSTVSIFLKIKVWPISLNLRHKKAKIIIQINISYVWLLIQKIV